MFHVERGGEMRDRCPNAWFGAHRFEPRYDERPNPDYVAGDYSGPAGGFRKLLVLNTYVRDVCVKCGKTAERKP